MQVHHHLHVLIHPNRNVVIQMKNNNEVENVIIIKNNLVITKETIMIVIIKIVHVKKQEIMMIVNLINMVKIMDTRILHKIMDTTINMINMTTVILIILTMIDIINPQIIRAKSMKIIKNNSNKSTTIQIWRHYFSLVFTIQSTQKTWLNYCTIINKDHFIQKSSYGEEWTTQ